MAQLLGRVHRPCDLHPYPSRRPRASSNSNRRIIAATRTDMGRDTSRGAPVECVQARSEPLPFLDVSRTDQTSHGSLRRGRNSIPRTHGVLRIGEHAQNRRFIICIDGLLKRFSLGEQSSRRMLQKGLDIGGSREGDGVAIKRGRRVIEVATIDRLTFGPFPNRRQIRLRPCSLKWLREVVVVEGGAVVAVAKVDPVVVGSSWSWCLTTQS
jgi:hypothetical protein